MRLRRFVPALVLLSVVAPMLACSGVVKQAAQNAKDQDELKEIGQAWKSYLTAHQGNAPSKPEDLFEYLGGATSEPSQALKSGKYVLFWDVTISDMIMGRGGTPTAYVILAHAAETPTKGGLVLMADGVTVKQMSSFDYSSTKKASEYNKKKK